jgi:site-specific recombinase XerD
MTSNPPYLLHPLFDTARNLIDKNCELADYPTLQEFLSSCPDGAIEDWEQTARFLIDYSASSGTYSRFRGEAQRFLIFLWRESGRTLRSADSDDIDAYMRFLKSPPAYWVGTSPANGFRSLDGTRVIRSSWRPFVSKGSYAMRQATLDAAIRALSVFFRRLVTRGYLNRSPLADARRSEQKASRAQFEDDDSDELAPRLTDWQWNYLKESLLRAAEEDDKYERHLFIVMTMKSLYLRVSELAPQTNDITEETYYPTMGAFRQRVVEGTRYWHMKVLGKGNKERFIPLPSGYLWYLKRFRRWRALPPLPDKGEQVPMIPRKNGDGQVGKRAIENMVKESFTIAADRMEHNDYIDEALELRQVADRTHYLRHTGASMDIEAGRPIRHVSEDLGHGSVAFTEMIYISASSTERYKTGRGRSI